MWAYAIVSHASFEWKHYELAKTELASAKVSHASPVIFDAIADSTTEHLKIFNSQGLGNTVWAFAKAGHASLPRFDAIAYKSSPD
eukprot:10841316-Karenia_brevis.AAC.1